ncbi:MAG: UDP-N-acetylglucosamine 2-epimerase [Armatimonadota bacterium]|nr:MAG: UDP-N-acetylglucosamine 2-epimerase [Armatimonadota bacterium]
MRILCVAGSRGERAKLSPVIARLERDQDLTCTYVSRSGTVPTWDAGSPPPPALSLEVNDATPVLRAGAVVRWLEPQLEELRPEIVLICGSSDAAVGAALAASFPGIPLAHLDAGVVADSGPNSRLLDQASTFLIAPHIEAVQRLAQRGMEDAAFLCGDTLADGLPAEAAPVAVDADAPCLCYLGGAALESAGLPIVLAALIGLAKPFLLPAGPPARIRLGEALRKAQAHSGEAPSGEAAQGPATQRVVLQDAIRIVEPMDYAAMQAAVARAPVVITDSPTLQRECYFHGTVAVGLAPAGFPDAERSGWVRPVAMDEEAIMKAAQAPPPTTAPEVEAHRGAGERAASFVTGL